MRPLKLLLAVLAASALLAGGARAARRVLPRAPIAEGVSIGDHRVPDDDRDLTAWMTALGEAARRYPIHLRYELQVFDTTLGAVGVTIDIPETLARAKAIGHEGGFWQRLADAQRARRIGTDVPIAWSLDRKAAEAYLTTLAPALALEATDARLDLTAHKRIDDRPGRVLDVAASVEEIARSRHDADELVELFTRRVPAKLRTEDLARVDVENVLSAYETTFSLYGTGANRAVNIRTAARRLDGTLLRPGDVLSFNDVVGPRSRERGFVLAPEIQGDELKNGYGGGTCQLSSTLHVAALYGTLGILERQAHSRPSSYTQVGLDATVSFPSADLKLQNTLSYPLLIHAYFPRPNSVRVEILGAKPLAQVEYIYGVTNPEDFDRRIEVKPSLSPGQRILHQKGIRGFDATSVVRYHFPDGRTEERHYFSGYHPAPEIYWVAPGYDTAQLPPFEGATRTTDQRLTAN